MWSTWRYHTGGKIGVLPPLCSSLVSISQNDSPTHVIHMTISHRRKIGVLPLLCSSLVSISWNDSLCDPHDNITQEEDRCTATTVQRCCSHVGIWWTTNLTSVLYVYLHHGPHTIPGVSCILMAASSTNWSLLLHQCEPNSVFPGVTELQPVHSRKPYSSLILNGEWRFLRMDRLYM